MFLFVYIDESGSINNHNTDSASPFVIALLHVRNKNALHRAYKRFVSANLEELKRLDRDRCDKNGRVVRQGGKMFQNNKFRELKGSQFDAEMKRKFLAYFSKMPHFDVSFIQLDNAKLSDNFCKNTARSFNYILRLAISFYIKHGILPDEACSLQLDERNERTETKYFLENYLNTELVLNGSCSGPFTVRYFDSVNNHMIQIADVYANWYYSHLKTNAYKEELDAQLEKGLVKGIFKFPPENE